MANEANSRDTVPQFRWGETSGGGSVSANVVEPSSGKKDTGWVPGVDGIVGEWWNWLHWAARVAFRYTENAFGLGLVDNHVMAGAINTEGVITNGAGLTVNVSSARCWIGGALYTVPAATNLALAAADPSDDRLDLVYAKTSGSPAVPSYAVVTGTPSGTLPLPTPALPAGGVVIGTVKVAAAATTPSTKASLREFGRVSLDRVIARERLDVGDVSGTPVVTILDAAGLSNGLTVGDPTDPILQANPGLDVITLHPEAVTFSSSIRRKFDVDGSSFVSQGPATLENDGSLALQSSEVAWAPVRVPHGCSITAVRVHGGKVSTPDGISELHLYARAKATGALTDLGPATGNDGVAGSPFTLEALISPAHVVTQTKTYFIEIHGAASSGAVVYGAEVEYEETNPFDGI
jgi:hypothetical protein